MTTNNIILELLNGFRKSKVLFTATKLGIFDKLHQQGPCSASILAGTLCLNEKALSSLLDSCVALELLSKDVIPKEHVYTLNSLSKKYLVSESGDNVIGYVTHSNDVLYKLFGELESSIKTGETSWKESGFGDQKDAFAQVYKTEADMYRFLNGMHGLSRMCAPSVISAFDLSRFHSLVDLGGGTGALVVEACKQYPISLKQVSIFDLPSTLSHAKSFIAKTTAELGEEKQKNTQISLLGGDFFTDPLPAADIYVLSRILHDWDEERILKLMTKVYGSLKSGGAVLIAEKLLEKDHSGPVEGLLQSLNMLVQTGGQERSFEEYQQILVSVGFVNITCKKTGEYLDAILAEKK